MNIIRKFKFFFGCICSTPTSFVCLEKIMKSPKWPFLSWCNVYPLLFRSWNRWNKFKNRFLFENEILLELSISGSSFGTISHLVSDEIGWIEMVFFKYVIILNISTISLFSDHLEGTKETSCFFFKNFWLLVDLSVGFEPGWGYDGWPKGPSL